MDTSSISLTALIAQQTKVEVASNNVANAETPGYTAQQAQFVPMNPGVSVGAVVDTEQPVDLATEMINLINAKAAYQAAVAALQTAHATGKTLLAAV